MPRHIQTLIIGIAIIFAIAALLAVTNLWGEGHQCAWEFPKAVGCILGAREGLAGGLIGAGGALFAGWLAWSAGRDQIQTERELATAKGVGNLKAILIEMKDLIDTLNQIWRAIDAALLPEQTPEQKRRRISISQALLACLPGDERFEELKNFTNALAQELDPIKRGEFIRVWQAIDWIYLARKGDKSIEQSDDDGLNRLRNIRIHLSHFERYLRAFDATIANQFEARTKENVDHRGIAAHIRPMADKAERGEPL
jgi:hypothetical protein